MEFIFGCWSAPASSVDCRTVTAQMARFFVRISAAHRILIEDANFCAGVASFSTAADELAQLGIETEDMLAVGNVSLYDEDTVDAAGRLLVTRRDELHRVASAHADHDALARLNGDFTVAVLDKRKRSLSLVRDHLGILPLHYAHNGSVCAFSTLVRPLLETPWASRELDLTALATWVVTSYPGLERTCFTSARAVLPASIVSVSSNGQQTQRRYWQPGSIVRSLPTDRGEIYELVRQELTRSVVSRVRGAGPVAVKLSGGLDSSSIAGILCATFPASTVEGICKILPDAFGDPSRDERQYIGAMAGHHSNLHVTFETASDVDFLAGADVWNEMLASPCSDGGYYAERALTRIAVEQGARTIFSGDGGDYFLSMVGSPLLVEFLLGGRLTQFMQELRRLQSRYGQSAAQILRYRLLPKLAPQALLDARRSWRGEPWWVTQPLSQYMRGNAEFLRHLDRTDGNIRRPVYHRSMAAQENAMLAILDSYSPSLVAISQCEHGLKERYPLFDKELVALCMAIASEHKADARYDRLLIRKAAAPFLPTMISDRIGKGDFAAEYARRLKQEGQRMAAEIERARSNEYFRAIVDVEQALSSAQALAASDLDDYVPSVHEITTAPFRLAQFLALQ